MPSSSTMCLRENRNFTCHDMNPDSSGVGRRKEAANFRVLTTSTTYVLDVQLQSNNHYGQGLRKMECNPLSLRY